jgi:glucose/mannose-6-phosphate isomerase
MAGHPLDDEAFVFRNDPKGMYALTAAFAEQCRQARDIAFGSSLPALATKPRVVVLSGMGGSAAGGDFARAIFEREGQAPFLVNREYTLPVWVGRDTLVIACSYSGQTEETLASYGIARERGAQILAVTSGGLLAEWAERDGFPVILIPGGQPPRTALGFLFVPVLVACERWGLIPQQPFEAAFGTVEDAAYEKWSIQVPFSENRAKQLAQAMHGALPVLYGLGSWQGAVASRWKSQINENAKCMAFSHSFPELNHNEILGWTKSDAQSASKWTVAILEDGTESNKMRARARVTSELIGGHAEIHRVRSAGDALLVKMLSLTYLGDFVSLYLAALYGVDPETIEGINILKAALATVRD